MRQETTVMYRWFEEKDFHFNIAQARRESADPHLQSMPRGELEHDCRCGELGHMRWIDE
jgi:hypothetical protein